MTEQFCSMECDAFHALYLSDKILEAVFRGQTVKTVAYLRVSPAQQDLRSGVPLLGCQAEPAHGFRIDGFIDPTRRSLADF